MRILDIEQTDDGWLVEYETTNRNDGKPIRGVFHLTDDTLEEFPELADVRSEMRGRNRRAAVAAAFVDGYAARLKRPRRRKVLTPAEEYVRRRRANR